MDILNLHNKVCIVTGAGKGIGCETAKMFYNLGCKIAIITRNKNDILALEKELCVDNERFIGFVGDVSDATQVNEFVTQVIDKFHVIDILINNAGMRFRKKINEITFEEWQRVMNVNMGSVFLLSQCVGRYMVSQHYGKIINMTSIVGTLGLPELTAYAASKGAIISFTKSLALEWAKFNINVNAIAPGFCKTSYAEEFEKNKELYDFTISRTPLGKWGESSDISKACVFLASDMSDYVTGEVVNVDGGWSAW